MINEKINILKYTEKKYLPDRLKQFNRLAEVLIQQHMGYSSLVQIGR